MSGNTSFKVGDWLVEPELDRISRGSESVNLRPRVMDFLVYLSKQDGRVVSTDDIIDGLWPGQLITQGAVYNCVTELRQALGDDEDGRPYIENIPRRGYHLLAPVTGLDIAETRGKEARLPREKKNTAAIAGVTILFFVVVGLFVWNFISDRQSDIDAEVDNRFSPLANSVAVLPFQDLTPDNSNEHLADGIAEILIHQVSQVPDLHVIARQSSFSFKGNPTDVREIGKLLNVETVLEGSLQRVDGQLRITAQLIDTRSGMHIWSKIFDREEASIFQIQDEIASAVAAEISRSFAANIKESVVAAPSVDLDAYELYLLGRHRLRAYWFADSQSAKEAADLFEQAIAQDPGFSLAYAGLADVHLYAVGFNIAGFPMLESIERARWAVESALSLDEDLAEAHASKGFLSWLERDFDDALASMRHAIALNPSYLHAYQLLGASLVNLRMVAEAEQVLAKAELLDPLNHAIKEQVVQLAIDQGDFDRARNVALEMYRYSDSETEVARALQSLTDVEWEQGRIDKAIAYLELSRKFDPSDSVLGLVKAASAYQLLGDYVSSQSFIQQFPESEEKLFVHRFLIGFYFLVGDMDRLKSLTTDILEPYALRTDNPISNTYRLQATKANGLLRACDRAIEIGSSGEFGAEFLGGREANMWLALCYRRTADPDRADAALQDARMWANEISESGSDNAEQVYTLAQIKALEGDRDAALHYLEVAYELGGRNANFTEKDPFLEDFRNNARFQRVVAAMRKDQDQMRQRVAQTQTSGDWFSLVDIEPKSWMQWAGGTE